jgi:hypothetical protein
MNINLFTASYILQGIGFVFITLAWGKAFKEYLTGIGLYWTRVLMLIITTVAFFAYLFPAFATICYFIPGCFKPIYRDYLRLASGLILFLYGFSKFILYYTKDDDIPIRSYE